MMAWQGLGSKMGQDGVAWYEVSGGVADPERKGGGPMLACRTNFCSRQGPVEMKMSIHQAIAPITT